MAVSKAVRSGRLRKSVVLDGRGNPKIADPELADREWEASTDLSKAPGYVRERAEARDPQKGGRPRRNEGAFSLTDESAKEKHWRAKLAEQQFRKESGELVEAALVESQIAGVYSQIRTKLLGVPSRARQALPHLSTGDVEVLEDLVREALEDLVES